MRQISFKKRAQGALLGAFIGDALALGPHWYYNLDEMRRDYGAWVDDYTKPKAGRYHEGLEAGDLSQSGYLLKMTTKSLVDNRGYNHQEFCRTLEEELFNCIDGSPYSGPGGYTSQSIREAWKKRKVEKCDWSMTGGHADTTEAIERTLAIAIRYSNSPKELAGAIIDNTLITQVDEAVVSMTVAYGAVLALLVRGVPFDSAISDHLMTMVKEGVLPFHAVTGNNLGPPAKDTAERLRTGNFASPDALLTPSFIARAAADQGVAIEPAWKVSLVYGMPCAVYHILPSSYYLAAKFSGDFESGVLHAVNGGGQNQARAILTGALCGAQVGIDGIPQRFIDGLKGNSYLLKLAENLAQQADSTG